MISKRSDVAQSAAAGAPTGAIPAAGNGQSNPVAGPNGDGQPSGDGQHSGDGQPGGRQPPARRRATAESMAASQRDISVSEFFAKNRHLLGFDNPRKALLTTVKEAVDNALDACEEAGILPEIWVHIQRLEPDRYKVGVQDNGPGILRQQIPLIFGKLLYGSKFHRLRMSRGQQGIGISAAGMYGLLTTGKPVKIMSKISKRATAHYYEIQIDTKRNRPEILNGKGEGGGDPAQRPGPQGHRETRHRVDRSGPRHAGDHRAGGPLPARPRQRRRLPGADRHRQPARDDPLRRSGRQPWERPRVTDVLPPSRRRSSRTPTGSSWACWWACSRTPRPRRWGSS